MKTTRLPAVCACRQFRFWTYANGRSAEGEHADFVAASWVNFAGYANITAPPMFSVP